MAVGPIDRNGLTFGDKERDNALILIDLALWEDLGTAGDLTARATIPQEARGVACFVARSEGVLAGLPVVALLASRFEIAWGWQPQRADGERLERGTEIARIEGSMRSLLALERTALNFLQRLSGIATLTAQFVAEVTGTKTIVLDTRKTTPGWRALEKYAVRCGGGRNHRFGLDDAVLIKDNHLAWIEANAAGKSVHSIDHPLHGTVSVGYPEGMTTIASSIALARAVSPEGTTIEVEVDSLEQLDRALACKPDIILVDNLGPEALTEAVRRRADRAPDILLEASGGITLSRARALAETGIDRISVGALTHSAPALDIGLDFERALPS